MYGLAGVCLGLEYAAPPLHTFDFILRKFVRLARKLHLAQIDHAIVSVNQQIDLDMLIACAPPWRDLTDNTVSFPANYIIRLAF